MDIDFLILNTLANNNGSMAYSALLDAVPHQQGVYAARILRYMAGAGMLEPVRPSQPVRLTPEGYAAHLDLQKSADQQKCQDDQEASRRAQEASQRRRDRQVMIVSAFIGCFASLAASVLTVLAEHWLPILLG